MLCGKMHGGGGGTCDIDRKDTYFFIGKTNRIFVFCTRQNEIYINNQKFFSLTQGVQIEAKQSYKRYNKPTKIKSLAM